MNRIFSAIRKVLPVRACGAVIVAAGSASRMGGIDKVMAPLAGKPMIVHTVEQFQQCALIREIVIVTREDLVEEIRLLCGEFDKVQTVVVGGSSRQKSVDAGLQALSKSVKLAAVHDGARPLVSQDVIEKTVHAANIYEAAAPAVPVKDTIKTVESGLVTSTPDRSKLFAVQTPQVFDLDLLRAALKKAENDGAEVTDDCSAVERMGMSVKIVTGDERNMKVTTPMDLRIAEMFMEDTQ